MHYLTYPAVNNPHVVRCVSREWCLFRSFHVETENLTVAIKQEQVRHLDAVLDIQLPMIHAGVYVVDSIRGHGKLTDVSPSLASRVLYM